ncbi:MAG: cupredoxin domain-containing protein [Kastovskya adunca ATA6-11-RM4]|jgi:plastocyanin domain-containing protein|nr:cupredoxin domain-containing protein [Kastovskya adunca ATA6-11-RM4]
MLTKTKIYGRLVGLGLLLSIASGTPATARPIETGVETTGEFQPIEQPLPLKLAVTFGGLALIGAELWWFLFSKSSAKQAEAGEGVQEIAIAVDGGYDPDRVVVQAGQPVRLNFVRKDPSSCLEQVLLPDFHIAADLDLNQVTPVEFTPETPGQYQFTCGMNMFRGVVEVQESASNSQRNTHA